MTRDQRLEIHTLRELKWTYPKIATHIGISTRQAEYAAKQPLTPKKKKGRPPLLDTPKQKELVDYVSSSSKTRRMPYPEIPRRLDWTVCGATIRNALNKEGFHRRIARVKPVLTEENKKARLNWAREHL